eukprot:6147257-Karenia_brevis.AAC.1
MYDMVANIKREAINKKYHFVLGADFNAQVGSRTDADNPRTIGPHGYGSCNARGQWLKNWATTEDLVITNTFFEKQEHNKHTYTGPTGAWKQLDYMLVTRSFWKTVHDSEATNTIDLGSDHKSVR